MKTVLKSYKFRMYPSASQSEFLSKTFGSNRFLWNQLTAEFNSYSSYGPNVLPVKLKDLRIDHEWLRELSFDCVNSASDSFKELKKQFFNKARNAKIGRPRFKSKYKHQDSFTMQKSCMYKLLGNTIKIPKLKEGICIVIDRELPLRVGVGKDCNYRSATISRNPSGQYFVSILVREYVKDKPKTNRSIGIDVGLKDFFSTSDGFKASNPNFGRMLGKKLAVAQRHLARKKNGSNRRERQRVKVARIHQEIANQRHHFLHQFSTFLINNYDEIVIEDLNVAGMVRNHCLAKSISDVSWSEFFRQLQYKADWYGRTITKVDRFYPSTQTCSSCDTKSPIRIALGVSEWCCSTCGSIHDRDENAARNLKKQSATYVDNRCGEKVSLCLKVNDFITKHISMKRQNVALVARYDKWIMR